MRKLDGRERAILALFKAHAWRHDNDDPGFVFAGYHEPACATLVKLGVCERAEMEFAHQQATLTADYRVVKRGAFRLTPHGVALGNKLSAQVAESSKSLA